METNNENTLYTVTVYSENQIGLLSVITNIFTRRSLNIESLTASASAIKGIHKLTITTHGNVRRIEAVVKQIEKLIDVVKAFYYTDDSIYCREVALYKVTTEDIVNYAMIEPLIERYGARILEINKKFTIIQKTGQGDHIMELYDELSKIGEVLQFTRSGRISVTRSDRELVTEFIERRKKDKTI